MSDALRKPPIPTEDPSQEHVRRLDWRFLLPRPRLDDVLFSGPEDSALLAALRAALPQGEVDVECSSSRGERARHELAVVQGAEWERVERVHPRLAAGGWLYWETRCAGASGGTTGGASGGAASGTPGGGSGAPRQRRKRAQRRVGGPQVTGSRVIGPRKIRLALRALGYEAITLHWHHPDFERCRWLVPLDDPAGAAYFLARNRSPWAAAILRRLGSGVGNLPLLPRLASVSVVARKRGGGAGENR